MAPSRGLYSAIAKSRNAHAKLCQLRCLHTTPAARSGHNRWSKIKHDKGKNDAIKNRQRSVFAQEIATASKIFGPDPNMNPRLADIITKAKREGFAKASIETAIARGQGRSTSGVNLESVTIEAILPNNVGLMVECETDNRLRTLADVRKVIKDNGGIASPASFLFEKRGRIVFDKKEQITSVEVFDAALDAGATDIDDLPDGRVVVYTEPERTRMIGDVLSQTFKLEVATSGIVWDPNPETKVDLLDNNAAQDLCTFVDELHDSDSNVQGLAMNLAQGPVDAELWSELQERVNP